MTDLRIYLFGNPRLLLKGRPLATDRKKAVALLAYLLVTRQAHSREALATLLWPEYSTEKAFAYLRRTIWEINHLLPEGWLAAERDSVSWKNWEEIWLDISEFQALAASCHLGDDSEECLARLETAARLYQSGFMTGFTLPDAPVFDEWQFFTTEKLRSEQIQILERLSHAYARPALGGKAVDFARQWIELDKLNEVAHRWLMQLYASLDQRAAALRQYDVLRQSLETQLGLQPQPETTALYEEIKHGQHYPVRSTPPSHGKESPSTSTSIQHNPESTTSSGRLPSPLRASLPVPPTPFIGREQEIPEITDLLALADCRLLTLLGPGGIGKTRLAIQIAGRNVDQYPDGVFFIPLAPLNDAELIFPAIAKVLRFPLADSSGAARDQLLEYLQFKKLLLVLDNIEHLLTETSLQLAVDILATAAGVKLLISSRMRLNIQGEHIYVVGGMSTPPGPDSRETTASLEKYSAVRLFLQSAKRIQPSFHLTESNRVAVVEICQMLQGMPLGIELAAAWMELLEPQQILQEMQKNLDFLESDQHDLPDRQRSIRAVFETTWILLTPAERKTFLELAIFQSGFTRPAAEEIAGASLRLLTTLVNKSLLQHLQANRFAIHELLRQYALERLKADRDAWQDIHDRHSRYYLGYLAAYGQDLMTGRQKEAHDAIGDEIDNILQAYYWALALHDHILIDSAILYMGIYYSGWEKTEMETVSKRALDYYLSRPDESAEGRLTRIKLLIMHAISYIDYLEPEPAKSFQIAREMLNEDPELEIRLGFHFSVLAFLFSRDNPIEAIAMFTRNLERLRVIGEPWQISFTLRYLGWTYTQTRELEKCRQAVMEAMDIDIERGDQASLSEDLALLANLALSEHAYDIALQLTQRQKEIHESLGNHQSIAGSIQDLGAISLALGDYAQAIEYFHQAVEKGGEFSRHQWVAGAYSWESISALRLGEIEHAREARLQSLAISQESAYQTGIIWSYAELGEIERIDGNLGAAERWYRQALAYLESTSVYDLRAFANRGLGQIALTRGNLEEARRRLDESLKAANEEYFPWGSAYALSCLARVAITEGDLKAAELHLTEAAQVLSRWGDQGVALEMIAVIAELYLAEDRPADAIALATFLLDYQGTWYETRERASELIIRAASRLASTDLSNAQHKGQQIVFDQMLDKIATGDIQHLCD